MPKHRYIFPNFMADFMAKLDLRTQYEASMMSAAMICVGLIVTVFYMFIYIDSLALWYKIFLVINGVAGLGFIGSMLVTTYQQYLNYMEAFEFQKQRKK